MGDENFDDIFADYESLINNTADKDQNKVDGAQDTEENVASPNNAIVRRRIIRNPRPKLNADRLCGERGIPGIEKHFENVKFKGKGHETEDLNKLLSTLEHWAHRLFPSLKYEECLTHIEKLGRKKPVQVCARKIRMGMPILADDFIHDIVEEEANDARCHSRIDEEHHQSGEGTSAFDQLIAVHPNELLKTSSPVHECNIHSPPLTLKSDLDQVTTDVPVEDAELSEEQKNRIEYKKKCAVERRKQRLVEINATLLKTPKKMDFINFEHSISEESALDTGLVHLSTVPKDVIHESSMTKNLQESQNSEIETDMDVFDANNSKDDTLISKSVIQTSIHEEIVNESPDGKAKSTECELFALQKVQQERKINKMDSCDTLIDSQQELNEDEILLQLDM